MNKCMDIEQKRSSKSINQNKTTVRRITETGFSTSGESMGNMSIQKVSKHDERDDIKVSAVAPCNYSE
jgi:hypothetical protein